MRPPKWTIAKFANGTVQNIAQDVRNWHIADHFRSAELLVRSLRVSRPGGAMLDDPHLLVDPAPLGLVSATPSLEQRSEVSVRGKIVDVLFQRCSVINGVAERLIHPSTIQ